LLPNDGSDNNNRRLCWSYKFVDQFLAQVVSVNGKPKNNIPNKRFFSGLFGSSDNFNQKNRHFHKRSADQMNQPENSESPGADKLLCWKYDDVNEFLKEGVGQNPTVEKKLPRLFTASKTGYLDRKRQFR